MVGCDRHVPGICIRAPAIINLCHLPTAVCQRGDIVQYAGDTQDVMDTSGAYDIGFLVAFMEKHSELSQLNIEHS